MSTLLIRLAGPMQAWGTQSRFSVRDTGAEPSKSGAIGLLCAALGKPRHETPGDGWPSLAQLAALRMGVRVDRAGVLRADYHTAGGTHRVGETYGVYKAHGKGAETVTSTRYYLADASFLVGLEGHPELLRRLDQALACPVWQLFLGRKSLVPSVPVRLPDDLPWGPGLRDQMLAESLRTYPYFPGLGEPNGEGLPAQLRLVLEVEAPGAEARHDVPLSFERRRFATRYVRTSWIPRPEVRL